MLNHLYDIFDRTGHSLRLWAMEVHASIQGYPSNLGLMANSFVQIIEEVLSWHRHSFELVFSNNFLTLTWTLGLGTSRTGSRRMEVTDISLVINLSVYKRWVLIYLLVTVLSQKSLNILYVVVRS